MSHNQQPVPDLQQEAPAAAAPETTSPALDATIARIEQGSRDMQQYLDSIEQKIARLEPELERLRQPQQEPAPPLPPPDPAPDASSAPSPGSPPRRRRSDQDGFHLPPGDRRRSERLHTALPPVDTLSALPDSWQRRLRSRGARTAGVALAVLLAGSVAWLLLAAIRRPSTQSAQLPTAAPAAQPGSTPDAVSGTAPGQTAAEPDAAYPAASRPRPSAAVPNDPTSPATAAGEPSTTASSTPAAEASADLPAASASDPADAVSPSTDPRITTSTSLNPSPRSGALRVSSGIMAANLIYSRQPEQPGGLARLFRLSGRVTMQVVVSRSGRVVNIRVLSGHRLLRGSAKDAVAAWRYRPFLVNGSPVEVATIVSVDFHR